MTRIRGSDRWVVSVEVCTVVPASILQEAVRRLVESFQPVRIILFGSQARGTADDRSDVDLLVICPVNGR